MNRSLASILAVTSTAAAAQTAAKPNIVFVLTDQWRASAFGFAGDPNVKTPQLDKLAANSIRFVNTVSVCPVCTPYRASVLTGRYPTSTGMFMNDLYLPDRESCMAEMFKDGGYDTAYIGKWHLDGHGRSNFIPPERRQGFDYWKAAECDHNYPQSHYYEGNDPAKKHWQGYDAYAQTKDAQQYLRARKTSGGKPFLLFLSYGSPHFPHATAPDEFKALYPPDKLKLAANVPPERAAQVRKELSGYYAHCSALDRCVGELLETLRETGLEKDTLVVFTSDHGEMMGAHGVQPSMKQWPYDESALVPFLLRDPRHPARVLRTPLNTPDILPTLLGLTGLAVPPSVEGEDLSEIVRGQQPERDRAAMIMGVSPFISGLREFRAIRTMQHTYVRDLTGPWMMFDNSKDPLQMTDLVKAPEHEAVRRGLDDQLNRELQCIGDDFRPRAFYQKKWGYDVSGSGAIGYGPAAKVQSPAAKP